MVKIFRKTRLGLLSGNKTIKYLKYAIGEVVLVVIGILIAVTINNRNAGKKQEETLKNILSAVVEDLKSDTAQVQYLIDSYMEDEPLFQKVLQDSMTPAMVDTCGSCQYLIARAAPLSIEQRGYKLLLEYKGATSVEGDTLVSSIIDFYSKFIKYIQVIDEQITNDVNTTLAYWRDHYDWYADFILANDNEAITEYLCYSSEYKNRLAHHYLYVYENAIPYMKIFKGNSVTILKLIEERLEEEH